MWRHCIIFDSISCNCCSHWDFIEFCPTPSGFCQWYKFNGPTFGKNAEEWEYSIWTSVRQWNKRKCKMCWGRVEWLNLLEVGSRCARQEEKVSLHSNTGQSADIILFHRTQVRSLPHSWRVKRGESPWVYHILTWICHLLKLLFFEEKVPWMVFLDLDRRHFQKALSKSTFSHVRGWENHLRMAKIGFWDHFSH